MNAQIETTPDSVRDVLVVHPFFKGIKPCYVDLLTDCASFERFGMGQDLFREGEDADHFYPIHKGQVALETFMPRVGSTIIKTIGPGDALGWSWLYPPYRWQFSARAIDPVEAVAFGAVGLRERGEENPDLGYELVTRVGGVMLQRLQGTRRRAVEFYTRDGVD